MTIIARMLLINEDLCLHPVFWVERKMPGLLLRDNQWQRIYARSLTIFQYKTG